MPPVAGKISIFTRLAGSRLSTRRNWKISVSTRHSTWPRTNGDVTFSSPNRSTCCKWHRQTTRNWCFTLHRSFRVYKVYKVYKLRKHSRRDLTLESRRRRGRHGDRRKWKTRPAQNPPCRDKGGRSRPGRGACRLPSLDRAA